MKTYNYYKSGSILNGRQLNIDLYEPQKKSKRTIKKEFDFTKILKFLKSTKKIKIRKKLVFGFPLLPMVALFLFGYILQSFDSSQKLPKNSPNTFSLPSGLKGMVSDNPYAPISPALLGDKQSLDYVNRFSKTAVTEMNKYGIPASIKLAQGLIESRAGKSKLATRNNNHFGIKCFSKRCGKGHCSNFSDDHHKDFFRKFDSAWMGWRAHSKLLAGPRYKHLKKYGKNYKKWARGLKKAGYATDKRYAKKLIEIIEKFKLYQFDTIK